MKKQFNKPSRGVGRFHSHILSIALELNMGNSVNIVGLIDPTKHIQALGELGIKVDIKPFYKTEFPEFIRDEQGELLDVIFKERSTIGIKFTKI